MPMANNSNVSSSSDTVNYIPLEKLEEIIKRLPDLGVRVCDVYTIEMLFRYCFWCALRVNEALRFDTDHWNNEESTVFLPKTKSKSKVYVTIREPLKSVWDEWCLSCIANGNKKPFGMIKYVTLTKWLYRLGEMCDVKAWQVRTSESGEKTLTHIFRKSMSKGMKKGDVHKDGKKADIYTIKETLRHKDVGVTSRYLRISAEEVEEYWN